jgi:hypothetical protein
MRNIKFFLLIAVIAILTSCEREPIASFQTDSMSYMAGQTVYLTNTTANGNHYVWTMPDGSTQTSTNATYVIPICESSGNLTFTLEAYSRNGKKKDGASQTVSVQAYNGGGSVTFWSNDQYEITVTFGGVVDSITQFYSQGSPQTCDASGCANFDGIPYCQYYYWTATDGTNNWSDSTFINSDCQIYELNVYGAAKHKNSVLPLSKKSANDESMKSQKKYKSL